MLGSFVARVMKDSGGRACPVRVDATLRELLGPCAQREGHVGRKAARAAAAAATAAQAGGVVGEKN